MTLNVKSVAGYALIRPISPLAVKSIVGYAFLKARERLPVGKTGLVALNELIASSADEDITGIESEIRNPTTVEGPSGTNTRVDIRLLDIYAGRMEFFYNRRLLEDAWIASAIGTRSVTGLNNTHQLLEWLSTSSGLVFEARDIVS